MTKNNSMKKNDGLSLQGTNKIDQQWLISNVSPMIVESLLENSDCIVSLWSNSGFLKYMSKAAKQILQINPQQVRNNHWTTIFPKETHTYIKSRINQVGTEPQAFQLDVQVGPNQINWYNVSVQKIKNEQEQYYFSILYDISYKKLFDEVMIQSEQMSVAGQLAAGVAHEIRNPLTSLKGFLQLLQAGIDGEDAYYKIMIDEINKIESITSELLYISKPLTIQKQVESTKEMILEVVSLLAGEARLNNVHIKKVIKTNSLIYCNRTQIKQALINIVKNAIEAVSKDSTITIKSELRNSYIYIDIIDEGPGIPDHLIPKLSKPFYTTKQEGTGLGLMITQKIMDEHNGRLEILQNEIKGSTFRLILPIARESA